jgi:hypothetical protein
MRIGLRELRCLPRRSSQALRTIPFFQLAKRLSRLRVKELLLNIFAGNNSPLNERTAVTKGIKTCFGGG